jgi:hypothetical protein
MQNLGERLAGLGDNLGRAEKGPGVISLPENVSSFVPWWDIRGEKVDLSIKLKMVRIS